ncbi:uncharacterized protein BDW43DRAFT_300453 [Aspergillus alliaceus]|uniref:uncharacterized protein n=1 Tax=Petromyces alliaceus TaxID=209559 RepID=UPI0012A4CC7B|nr:uncharacterized protein BDW43DRAFT_300453 [Aspergillus alliaceus]KAB8233287.1 hypothetical protein BDW43DRAFT_300453 [Aspergillus alliaceus]
MSNQRRMIVRPPAPPPSCEESVHYPVFNPRDPRHNPAVATSSWDRDSYYISPSTSLESPVSWVQSLPKRSLRKARSGLVALRAGMQRRAAIFASSRTANVLQPWPLSDTLEGDQQDDSSFPSTISEASTEEDSEFGTHLHRTECNDSSSLSCDVDKCLDNWPFSVTINDLNPFQELSGGYWPPGLFLTEAAHCIFPGDSTDVNNGLGPHMPRELTTGDYIQLDDYFMNESDSQSEDSRPELSRLSKSLPGPGCSQIRDANTQPTLATIPTPFSNSPLAPTSPGATSMNGNTHRTMSPLPLISSPETPKLPTSDGETKSPKVVSAVQSPGRFYASRTPQVSSAALVAESRGLIDRVSGYSDNSITRTEDGTEGDASESAPCQEPSSNLQAEPVESNRPSITNSTQTQDNSEARTNASTSNNPVQTMLAFSLGPETVASEVQDDNGHDTPSRPSGDTNGLACSDFSRGQAPWSTRPSEDATATDLTSVSNNVWTPIENGDLTSLLSLTDEYFLVDGKTSGHPDRGDNPTKAERSIVSDGSLYSGPGFDCGSIGTIDVPEIIGPGRPVQVPSPRAYRAERDPSDDSIDEYLLTYPMYQRRYFS